MRIQPSPAFYKQIRLVAINDSLSTRALTHTHTHAHTQGRVNRKENKDDAGLEIYKSS